MIVLTKLPETGHWAWWLGSHIGHLLSDEKECVIGLITHTHTHSSPKPVDSCPF